MAMRAKKPSFRFGLMGAMLVALPATAAAQSAKLEKPIVMGWVERAVLLPSRVPFLAKLDTGAKTTSINAQDVTLFEKEGRKWVRFTVRNSKGDSTTFERPVVRTSRIRRTGVGVVTRPVVSLRICIGRFKTLAQVNLANRKNMRYQLLIGRRLMEGRILVDSQRQFVVSPACD